MNVYVKLNLLFLLNFYLSNVIFVLDESCFVFLFLGVGV